MSTASVAGVIPLVDLQAQYRALKPEMDRAIIADDESGSFVLGLAVEKFERDFAAYLGVTHFVACQSGTSAIALTPRGKAILAVHLYGQPGDMDALAALAVRDFSRA